MKTFTADQFTPTKFDTAEDKAKFANQFVKFVSSGFKQSNFTKAFYRRLSMTFGHIAHYNQYGFWDTFFTNVNDKVAFIEQSLNHPCYGDPAWTYSDVERALQTWLVENKVHINLRQEADEERTASDLATLARLKKQYEPA
jgi:hypothetical protein